MDNKTCPICGHVLGTRTSLRKHQQTPACRVKAFRQSMQARGAIQIAHAWRGGDLEWLRAMSLDSEIASGPTEYYQSGWGRPGKLYDNYWAWGTARRAWEIRSLLTHYLDKAATPVITRFLRDHVAQHTEAAYAVFALMESRDGDGYDEEREFVNTQLMPLITSVVGEPADVIRQIEDIRLAAIAAADFCRPVPPTEALPEDN